MTTFSYPVDIEPAEYTTKHTRPRGALQCLNALLTQYVQYKYSTLQKDNYSSLILLIVFQKIQEFVLWI